MFRSIRQNTVKFSLNKSTRHVRPTATEVHIWFADKVNINIDQIDGIQLNIPEYCIYLKFSSLGTYERFLRDTPCGLSDHQISACPTRRNRNVSNTGDPIVLNMSNLVNGRMPTTPRYEDTSSTVNSGNKAEQNEHNAKSPFQCSSRRKKDVG